VLESNETVETFAHRCLIVQFISASFPRLKSKIYHKNMLAFRRETFLFWTLTSSNHFGALICKVYLENNELFHFLIFCSGNTNKVLGGQTKNWRHSSSQQLLSSILTFDSIVIKPGTFNFCWVFKTYVLFRMNHFVCQYCVLMTSAWQMTRFWQKPRFFVNFIFP